MATDGQNPYQSALIATASAEAEAKRQLNVAQAAATAYPDNSLYQAQVTLNQQRLSATQQAYTNAQTNFDSANAPIAKLNSEGIDTGTNVDTRTLSQSQSTPAKSLSITNDDNGEPWAAAAEKPGVGAAGEDSGKVTTATTSTTVNAASALGNPITPSPNVLDQYASYTYSLSWYALTPAQYTAMQKTNKIDTNTWSLLIQSGGASVGANRNKYFSLDYYMDNLVINTTFNDNGPSTVTTIEFSVTEPNGITLLQNLNNALRDLYKQPTGSVAKVAPYVMVIRFYGYDAEGNLVTKVSQAPGTPGATPGLSNAVVVKYIPFMITDFSFKAASRAVEYQIKGTPSGYKYAKSSALGSVPFPLELSGETVNDVLNGKISTVTVPTDTDRGTTNTTGAVTTGPQQPTASYNSNGTVNAADANSYGAG